MKHAQINLIFVAVFFSLAAVGCNLTTKPMDSEQSNLNQPTLSEADVLATTVYLTLQPGAGITSTPDQAVTTAPVQSTADSNSPTQTVMVIPTQAPAKDLPSIMPTAVIAVSPTVPNSPTDVPTERPTLQNTPTVAPTEDLTPTATAAPNPAAPTDIPIKGSYAVIMMGQGSSLNPRVSPGSASLTFDKLDYNAKNLTLTGKQSQSGGQTWVEVTLAGGSGWVNRADLTESVSKDAFCQDPQLTQLLADFTKALSDKDSSKFTELVSPVHGLTLQAIRGGTLANYDLPKSSWVLQSSYVVDWGRNPGSGAAVRGSFSETVLPNLLDVLSASHTKKCGEIALGGASYEVSWPSAYENINYVSLYRPGPTGNENDWRTWLLGVEYVGGKPYLFSLNQYVWEP
jgi:hypothetical protein